MSTTLTDDEIATAIAHLYAGPEVLAMALPDELHSARAIEAAVLAKLERQEPVAGVVRCEFDDECDFCESPQGGTFTRLIHNPEDVTEAEFYICGDCLHQAVTNYTHPAPQQADRQRVPDGWREALQTARDAMAGENRIIPSAKFTVAITHIDAMLAAAPEAPAQEGKQ